MSYECGHCEAGGHQPHAPTCPHTPVVDPELMAETLWKEAEAAEDEGLRRRPVSTTVLRHAAYALYRMAHQQRAPEAPDA